MSWSRTVGHPCHCSSHCAPGVKAIPCQATTAPAALAAGPAADHIQVGSSDIQGLQHVHSGVPTLPNCRTCLQLKFMFICHPSTGVHPFNRTDFSRHAFRFSTSSLCNSLSKTVLISDWSLPFYNPDFNFFLFIQAFSKHWSNIIIIKHVLIKVTLSCQRHCRGTALANHATRKLSHIEIWLLSLLLLLLTNNFIIK